MRLRGIAAGEPHKRLRTLAPRFVARVGCTDTSRGMAEAAAGPTAAFERAVAVAAFWPRLEGCALRQSVTNDGSEESGGVGGGTGGGDAALSRRPPPPKVVRDAVAARLLRRALAEAERDAAPKALAMLAEASRLGALMRASDGIASSCCNDEERRTAAASVVGNKRPALQLFSAICCAGRWGLLKEALARAVTAEAEAEGAIQDARAALRDTVERLRAAAASADGGSVSVVLLGSVLV